MPSCGSECGSRTGNLTLAWRFSDPRHRGPTNEILTLTFTEKAALEMAERIKNLLLQLAMELPSQKVFFQKAADRIDEGYISTIHSFSMRVLKECGLATELDPESGTIAPPQESLFWKEAEEALTDGMETGLPKAPPTYGPSGSPSFSQILSLWIVSILSDQMQQWNWLRAPSLFLPARGKLQKTYGSVAQTFFLEIRTLLTQPD